MSKRRLLQCATAAAAVIAISVQHPSAYTLKTAKWAAVPAFFYVNTANLDAAPSAVLSAVQFGASAWTNQSSAAFSFFYAGSTSGSTVTNNGKNEVFFRNASNGNAIATTYTYSSGGRILDTDIVFWDGGFKFFTGSTGCSGGFYVEDIATHEFGHALGLGHSTVSGATMAPSIGYCSMAARSLSTDDRQGVEALYPSTATNASPTVRISSPSAGASYAEGASIAFSGSAPDNEDGELASQLVWTSSRDGQIGTGPAFQRVLTVGSHTVTARVTDSAGAPAEAQITIAVSAADAGITLSANGYKVKGQQTVELRWSGATAASVDIYRNATMIGTSANNGRYVDGIRQKGAGEYSYVVCDAGTTRCSNTSRVVF